MTLQRKKEDLSGSRGPGSWNAQTSSWPGGAAMARTEASPSNEMVAMPRSASPSKPMVPPLQLNTMKVKQPAPAASPPHSGRRDQSPAQAHMALSSGSGSMLMPVAGSGGHTLLAITPRTLVAPVGAAQEDATPVVNAASSYAIPCGHTPATSSTVRLAMSPRPARVGSLTMMVNSAPAVHQRTVTPGMPPRMFQDATVVDMAGQPQGQRIWAYPALAGIGQVAYR